MKNFGSCPSKMEDSRYCHGSISTSRLKNIESAYKQALKDRSVLKRKPANFFQTTTNIGKWKEVILYLCFQQIAV